jgi:prefoldin subunit 5
MRTSSIFTLHYVDCTSILNLKGEDFMNFFIKTTAFASALFLTTSTVANPLGISFGATAWEMVKKFAINVASDVAAEYLKPNKPSQDALNKTQQQLAELNNKINELEKQAIKSPQLEQLANTLNKMHQEMTQKFEDRQAKMEQHFSTIRQTQQQLETVNDDNKTLQFPIAYITRSSQDKNGVFKPFSNGDALKSGDTYKVIFTPNENFYVYIFQKDATNQVQRLFPMQAFKEITLNNQNPVEKDRQYILPTKEKSFRLDSNVGIEKIYFMVSRYKDVVLENLPQTITLPTQEKAVIALFEQHKGFSEIVDDAEKTTLKWQENNQDMSTEIKTRLQSCNGCVHVLNFIHK